MTLEENLADLRRHAEEWDVRVHSWVRADRSGLDVPLAMEACGSLRSLSRTARSAPDSDYRFPRPNMRPNRSAIDLAGLMSITVDPSGSGRFAACSAERVVLT